MSVTLVVPDPLVEQLCTAAQADVESAAVLLARVVHTPAGNIRLLSRELRWVPNDAYVTRESQQMSIASHGYVPALAAAEADHAVPIWLHTHPGDEATPRPSRRDAVVDRELAGLFGLRSGSSLYAAVVISNIEGRLCFTGHIETDSNKPDIDRIWIVGRRFGLIQSWAHKPAALPDRFDRNVRAFGGEVQRVLGDLNVAVVGCGGSGSAVAEQLVRLGVRRLLLFDPDVLSATNITRVYGSYPSDIDRLKVDVLANHLSRIAPEITLSLWPTMITDRTAAEALLDADVIFGCTDDNAGRLVLSRAASYLLTPVIDCGVQISSASNGQLLGIDGRITVLAPGMACLVCRGRIDLERAYAETLAPDQHRRLAAEGYAPGLPGVEPAVITYTTQVAATAVSELIERLVHYGPGSSPGEVLLRLHEREISTNECEPRERHYCHPGAGKLGLGVTEPFLDQTWKT